MHSRTLERHRQARLFGRSRASLAALFAAALTLGALPPSHADQGGSQNDPSPPRPRVGLALSGGSARGIAHVGVLQWLEEHHIPVDRIAGNSTGALMGASYATGLSPEQIKTLLRDADWDTILRPDIPYPLRSYRRKEDDRDFAIKIEGGLRHGFKLQSGINPGHHLSLLVSRILLPYSAVANFDDLPIPFRCVATDLGKGETVVFDRGPLPVAVRASMSLPGTYDPLRVNGRLFADGGILNNVPVDVARDMGADVVIAVRVGPKAEEETVETITGIAHRAITLMMRELERPRLNRADVVILPDTHGLTADDFRRSDELAKRGYAAAEARKEDLMRYALDDAAWAAYRFRLASRMTPNRAPVTFVEVTGISDGAGTQIAQQLSRHIGQEPRPEEVELDLNRIVGLGRYGSAIYGRRRLDQTEGLSVAMRDKSYGPPFVRFSLDVSNESTDVNLNVGSRVTLMDVTGLGSEWRLDAGLGSTLRLETELYQPLGGKRPIHGGAFISPRASYAPTNENIYRGDDLVAIYGRQRAAAGVDFGWNSGGRARFRAGYEIGHVRNVTRVGDPLLPPGAGAEQILRARIDYDGRNAAYLESRGVSLSTDVRWFLEAPEASGRFGSIEARFSAAHPAGGGGITGVALDGGATFGGEAPTLYQFSLGGPRRLGSFPTGAFRGPRYLLGSVDYKIKVARLPKLFGGPVYLDGRIEVGSVFDVASRARFKSGFTAGVTADTLLGPFFVGGSVGERGHVRIYFVIGRLVR